MKNSTKETDADHKALTNLLAWLLGAAYFVPCAVGFLYYYKFSKFGLSPNLSVWGQFGDFLGGTLNPIFGFLTVVLLLLTTTIQNKQLRLSKIELELTRHELQKSAEAQNLSQIALNRQAEIASKAAKLNTINFLIKKYETETANLRHPLVGTHDYLQKTLLIKKKIDLENMVESMFNELINSENQSNAVDQN